MGIVNVTPDSFSDGGKFLEPGAAIDHGLSLVADGADIVDIGGESTRPGAEPVPSEEEMARVLPVVAGLAGRGVVVSIDTSKPEVAEQALARGAELVNDVMACRSEGMTDLIADAGCGVILMHMRGEPRHMHLDPSYEDVKEEVERFLEERIEAVVAAGVARSRIAIDPGIGFGKTKDHNLELLGGLGRLSRHAPVVLGTSRKRFLGTVVEARSTADLDMATAVTTAVGFINGARVFRVHDVLRSRQALALATAMVTR
ncbi:MAG: dihydropteroate synthase [Actinobacteria bacterium]|nr:dihydropteroate synthase [Actinomycetota bacterium]